MMDEITPLHELESAAGAHFASFCGWEVASHYGDPAAEYDALRRSAGVLNVCFTGRLRITGKDRTRYLHSMLTNDIRALAAGEGCYAALLTRQGWMEADLWVYAFQEEYRLECPPCAAGQVYGTLSRHIVGDILKIDVLDGTSGMISLQGPGSKAVMERTCGIPLPDLQPLSHRSIDGTSGEWLVACRDRTGSGGFDLWLPASDMKAVWRSWTEVEGVRAAGLEAWNQLRTEAGIPWYCSDMTGKTLPMEMGLDSAISFKKGCYRGQEIVARIKHRGHLDRRLGAVAIDCGELPPGGAPVIHRGERIGAVTSAVHSPRLGRALALAVLRSAFLEPGTAVEVEYGGNRRPGVVVILPLRD